MSATVNNIPTVSAMKSMLKTVIKNLDILENIDSNQLNEINTNNLQIETEQLLDCLEKLPLKSIARKISNKRKCRKNKVLYRKKFKSPKPAVDIEASNTYQTSTTAATASTKLSGSYIQMHVLQEGRKFLKIFDKLEELHFQRGQNSEETKRFAEKLQPLRAVWNDIMQDNRLHEESPDKDIIQQQWNTALFGSADVMNIQRHCDVKDFIRKRAIWDSYITKKHKGSRIPLGYVFPPVVASKNWSKYLSHSKID